ncbi:MAG: DUF192 domain-containing protein [Candidatus Woesearchaeota archaeon]
MKKYKTILLVVTTIIFVAFGIFILRQENEKKIDIEINNETIETEVASTKKKRTKGLSERESISFDEGMLYVYEEPDYIAMWMKGMNFPLDIIWLDEDKKIITYKKNVSPSTYPDYFTPDKPAKYVVEVKSGFIKKNNLQVGEKFNFDFK